MFKVHCEEHKLKGNVEGFLRRNLGQLWGEGQNF